MLRGGFPLPGTVRERRDAAYLNSHFLQVDCSGDLFPLVQVWVVSFAENPLQMLKLKSTERRPFSPATTSGVVAEQRHINDWRRGSGRCSQPTTECVL